MHPRELVQKNAGAQERIQAAASRLAKALGLDTRLVSALNQHHNSPELRRLREHEATAVFMQAVAATVIEAIGFSDRVRMAGLPVALGPRAALSFSLIVAFITLPLSYFFSHFQTLCFSASS